MSGANIKRLMDPEILAAIMDSATDGFTYTDETGYIVYNNRAYSEMTGLPDEKIQGHNIHQLVKEGFPISRMMLEVFQSRETRSELIKYQADSERLLLVTLSPVYSPDGRFRGAVGNVRDMTELMQLRQQMDITYLDYDREMQVKEKANRELVQRINEMLHLMEDYDIVGRSKAMHNLAELALRVSHVRSTVLITGESGVGKDVFCRMICRFAGSPDYIKISCGNLPENLLESELFGYEAGAFTGANRTGKRGNFELAGDGVIFLDEIGELPPQLQVKLLTVLQDRRFYRIGGTAPLPMNARVVAATNRDLKKEVAQGSFRRDLYYRLNVIPVHIPPLRERTEDILPLAEHILLRLNRQQGTAKLFGQAFKKALLAYRWPGNIRELNNIIERAFVLARSDTLELEDLPDEMTAQWLQRTPQGPVPAGSSLHCILEEVEAAVLAQRLQEDRTLSEIAATLGIDLSTLVRKIKKYNLPKRHNRGK